MHEPEFDWVLSCRGREVVHEALDRKDVAVAAEGSSELVQRHLRQGDSRNLVDRHSVAVAIA